MFTGYLEHLHLKGDRVVFIHAFDPPPMQSAKHSEYHEMATNLFLILTTKHCYYTCMAR